MKDLRQMIRRKQALIHCITNPISMTQCANAVLAMGARPMMAEHPEEVEEITATAGALLLNLGNISDIRMEAMRRSLKTAKKYQIPVVLDAVGVACSALRRTFAMELLAEKAVTIVKGNYSEITALCDSAYYSSGVDADKALCIDRTAERALALSEKYHAVILASGEKDLVADRKQLYIVNCGTPQLANITGTGCMLGAVCAACLASEDASEAAVDACMVMGICGELSETEQGSGSFLKNLLDQLSTWSEETILSRAKVEVRTIEKL